METKTTTEAVHDAGHDRQTIHEEAQDRRSEELIGILVGRMARPAKETLGAAGTTTGPVIGRRHLVEDIGEVVGTGVWTVMMVGVGLGRGRLIDGVAGVTGVRRHGGTMMTISLCHGELLI